MQAILMLPGLSTIASTITKPSASAARARMKSKMPEAFACGKSLVIALIVLVVVGIFIRYTSKKEQVPLAERIICPGFHDITTCIQKGCAWDETNNTAPSCYLAKGAFGYIVQNIAPKNYCTGYVVNLEAKSSETPYGKSSKSAIFNVTYINNRILRFQIYDRISRRYSVPIENYLKTQFWYSNTQHTPNAYEVLVVNKNPGSAFEFYVKRKESNAILFNTSIGGLMMADQFLQIASHLPSSNIYGLGENNHAQFRHDLQFKSWPIFAKNQYSTKGQKNLYGVHPFYTCLEEDGKSHGVLFLNSNAMEVTLMPAPGITFRTVGGILDFFIFVGDNPEHVIQLYTSVIGRPMLPPYWSLGFHFDLGELVDTEEKYEELNDTLTENEVLMLIPSEVHYTRINIKTWHKLKWMHETKKGDDKNPKTGPQLTGYVPRHKIVTIDSFAPFLTETEEKDSIFVADSRHFIDPDKSTNACEKHIKQIPPPWFNYPNFFDVKAQQWWEKTLKDVLEVTHANGIYLELNEPTFLPENSEEYGPHQHWSEDCTNSRYENPPYNPVLEHGGQSLSFKTLCMASQHFHKLGYYHYDVHNIHGLIQSKTTQRFYNQLLGRKSLVMSQSTYVTSGTCSGHILGNKNDEWEDLRRTVIGVLEFNLFGIPLVGADVCDFHNNKGTNELCKRSLQLGAYLPFYRNRYFPGHKLRGRASFIYNISKAAYAPGVQRSKLLPHLYTLFYKAHTTGSTVVRPLFHEFPTDKNTWSIDTQFMWGSNMIISPILQAGIKSMKIYLPNDTWYRFDILRQSEEETEVGQFIYVQNLEEIPVHIRGGSIIPTQVYQGSVKTSSHVGISLLVFPKNNEAHGELYLDNLNKGTVSADFKVNEKYQHSQFTYRNCLLTFQHEFKGYEKQPSPLVHKICIHNAENVDVVYVNYVEHKSFRFHEPIKYLVIYPDKPLVEIKMVAWSDKFGNCKEER